MFAQKTRGVFAGWAGGCADREVEVVVVAVGGYLCVAMEPTEVDKRSNDCGDVARGGAGAGQASGRRLWLQVSQLLCLSVTWPRGVDWSVPYGGQSSGHFSAVNRAAQPPRMKHQGMCHPGGRPTVTTLFTPLRIKPQRPAFVFSSRATDVSLP